MPNHVKKKVRHTTNPTWNEAILEAERQLRFAKERVEGLERTIKNWRKLRDEGMRWPELNKQEQL